MKRIWMTLMIGVLAVAAVGCAAQEQAAETPEPAAEETVSITAEEAVTTTDAGTAVTLYVTSDGFVPANVVVPAGKPVTLHVTRKTEKTCATELVMAEHNIDLKLPMNETVTATFTPSESGELGYACAMDMIKGVVTVN